MLVDASTCVAHPTPMYNSAYLSISQSSVVIHCVRSAQVHNNARSNFTNEGGMVNVLVNAIFFFVTVVALFAFAGGCSA